MKKPMIINIEGVDGTGKNTISQELKKRFEKSGKKVLNLSFPDYNAYMGESIRRYLDGNLLGDPIKVDPINASLLYTVNRRIVLESIDDFMDMDVVIFDRSYMSNFFFQASKYVNKNSDDVNLSVLNSSTEIIHFIKFMKFFELDGTILNKVKDNIHTFYLYHHDINVNEELMSNREKKDLHESDSSYLSRVNLFAYTFRNLFGSMLKYEIPEYNYELIPCSSYDDGLFSIEDITDSIIYRLIMG